jgi:hypothetical protein
MNPAPQASADELAARLREQFEQLCIDVAAAVNTAQPGRVIADSEERVRDLLARFRQQTYQAAVQLRLEAAQAASPPPQHPQTGKRLQGKGAEPFSVLTVNGRVVLYRRRYFAKDVGSFAPLDDWLDAAHASISRGVAEMACRLNQASRCFAKAADNLARCAQLSLSREALRQLAESEGRAVLDAERSGKIPLGWDAADCFTHDERGRPTQHRRIYLGSDGVMVPAVAQQEKDKRRQATRAKRRRRGKKCRPLPRARPGADESFKEVKIVTYYDEPAAHRLVVLTRHHCEHAGVLMRQAAARVGLPKADDKVALVDGAPWIRNQLRGQSLPLDAIGLDYYHFAENVHKARRAVYGEEEGADGPGKAWAAGLLHLAKEADYVRLEEAIWEWAFRWRGAKRKAAVALSDYVSEREEMVRYKEFLQAGRQIGSGPTESMCKAATLRVKGVGKKWDIDNAEAVMALEALDQSGLWERYWNLPPLLAL